MANFIASIEELSSLNNFKIKMKNKSSITLLLNF